MGEAKSIGGIEISEEQRERFDRIREACKNEHVPAPSDELMFKSLMDEWEHETEHKHEVDEVLEKIDTAEWKVTNRMIDVDTGEVLYRLREVDSGNFTETEILTESQISRSFKLEGDR